MVMFKSANGNLNFSIEGFSDFACLARSTYVKLCLDLIEAVYGPVSGWSWGKALVDYNLGRSSYTHFYPTIHGSGGVEGHIVHFKVVSELGVDNVNEIVEDEDRYVRRTSAHYLARLDDPRDKTMILVAWKPTEKQKLYVKAKGCRGYLRAGRYGRSKAAREWFVEPIILASVEDEAQFKWKLTAILKRMLMRFYGVRFKQLLRAMDLPVDLHYYDPAKLYHSIYNNYTVYRESLRNFLSLLCRLLMWLRDEIRKHVEKVKQAYNVKTFMERYLKVPGQLAGRLSRMIVDGILSLADALQSLKLGDAQTREDPRDRKVEAALLMGKYSVT